MLFRSKVLSVHDLTVDEYYYLTVDELHNIITDFSSGEASNDWNQIATIRSQTQNDNFGRSVDISGNAMIIGAPNYNNFGGRCTIVENESVISVADWNQSTDLASLHPVTETISQNDLYGYSVAIYGNYAVVGSPNKNSYSGKVYIYKRNF